MVISDAGSISDSRVNLSVRIESSAADNDLKATQVRLYSILKINCHAEIACHIAKYIICCENLKIS